MRARALYGIVVVVRIVTVVWASLHLPAQIATHFGPSGAADGWGTRSGYITFDIIISAALVLGLPMLVTLVLRGSGAGLNIPHKDYWMRPENKPLLRRRLMADMLFLGGTTGLLLSWVDVEVVRANALATPVMDATSWVAIVAFVIVTIGYSIWMATVRYAVPMGQRA
jgi:uncharacterized membrane protein